MKLINPSVELITQESGIDGIYKQIEKVGRTCYKSEDKITENSAKPFVERMVNSQHYAMLEHGTVYLSIPIEEQTKPLIGKYITNTYSKVVEEYYSTNAYITTNYRVIIENDWQEDLKYLCEPTEYHSKRICLKFVTSIGVSREFNRHRVNSVAEQSTRYCNYSKEKFEGEVTYIKPSWSDLPISKYKPASYPKEYNNCTAADKLLLDSLVCAEHFYHQLISRGWKPQQARETLPLATATEVIYTVFEEDWKHFFDLRYRGTTGAPHPNAFQVASMAHKLIKEKLGKDL